MEAPERTGEAILIKKGHIIPENAEPMSDMDVIRIQENRIEKFKPQSEMRVFTWGLGTIGGSVALSSAIINNIFRLNFKLGGLRKMATYFPVVLVPTVASLLVHDYAIKRRILLNKDDCPLCVSLRSGAYQVSCGIVYPYIISILACVPVAREYYTLPLPVQKSGPMGYLRLLRHVSPSSSIILGLGLAHMFIGMKMASTEMKVYHRNLGHPPTVADLPLGMRYGK